MPIDFDYLIKFNVDLREFISRGQELISTDNTIVGRKELKKAIRMAEDIFENNIELLRTYNAQARKPQHTVDTD